MSPLAEGDDLAETDAARHGRRRDDQVTLQLFEALGADALDVLQLFDRFERAIRFPVIEDGLRLCRTDSGQCDQLFLRGGVEVDRGKRAVRKERQRENDGTAKHGLLLDVLKWRRVSCGVCTRYGEDGEPDIRLST
jgi:hypothetical protein